MSAFTLAAPARFLLEVKKSRFLALATPADSPGQAMHYLGDVADADATHNCWAYRIGQAYRFSDDGEPGGTAGRAILAAIEGQGLDRVMVVVTRWYGGINLGAGGLVRAYGGAAAECLRTAVRRELIETVDAELRCEFALASAVHALLAQTGTQKLQESFDETGLRLRLRLPATMVASVSERLRDLSRGAAILEPQDPPLR
ncbi:IMPACT family protein [Arenimonas sp.]|uniref:IMPACT family protein n=1 Tax=Arenimonas sp. TaxID=1872635 RepID=UPI0039E3B470